MTGTSWRAVSVPTQKSNGDLPRGPGRVTPSPGRSDVEAARVNAPGGGWSGRRVNTALIINGLIPVGTDDDAGLEITGDLDVRWVGRFQPWGGAKFLGGQWDTVFGGLRSYLLEINASNGVRLSFSADGTAVLTADSTVALTYPQTDAFLGIRATLDVNDGGGNRIITFYTSTDLGVTWTQLGAPVTQVGAITLHNSTADVLVNAHSGALAASSGVVVEFQVRGGIDGTILTNPRFSDQPARQPQFQDGFGHLWVIPVTNPNGFIGVV